MAKKCWYMRESPIELFSPSCYMESGEDGYECYETVHDSDVDTYCPFCGRKIKIKEWSTPEPH